MPPASQLRKMETTPSKQLTDASSLTSPSTAQTADTSCDPSVHYTVMVQASRAHGRQPAQRDSTDTQALYAVANAMQELRDSAPFKSNSKSTPHQRDIGAVLEQINSLIFPDPSQGTAWIQFCWTKAGSFIANEKKRMKRAGMSRTSLNEEPNEVVDLRGVGAATLASAVDATQQGSAAVVYDRMDRSVSFRLVHCIAHVKALDMLKIAQISASRSQLDAAVTNKQLWISQPAALYHDAQFDPTLDSALLQNKYNNTVMPDPGYRGKKISHDTIQKTVQEMQSLRTLACRDLPSGTNSADLQLILEQCINGNGATHYATFHLINMMIAFQLIVLQENFISTVEGGLQHDEQSFDAPPSSPADVSKTRDSAVGSSKTAVPDKSQSQAIIPMGTTNTAVISSTSNSISNKTKAKAASTSSKGSGKGDVHSKKHLAKRDVQEKHHKKYLKQARVVSRAKSSGTILAKNHGDMQFTSNTVCTSVRLYCVCVYLCMSCVRFFF